MPAQLPHCSSHCWLNHVGSFLSSHFDVFLLHVLQYLLQQWKNPLLQSLPIPAEPSLHKGTQECQQSQNTRSDLVRVLHQAVQQSRAYDDEIANGNDATDPVVNPDFALLDEEAQTHRLKKGSKHGKDRNSIVLPGALSSWIEGGEEVLHKAVHHHWNEWKFLLQLFEIGGVCVLRLLVLSL